MLSSLLYTFPFMLVITGFWCFVSQHKHLLSTLLSLELIILGVYLFMYCSLSSCYMEVYFCLLFLTFCVCEGSLSLSILVSISRTHGNDSFGSLVVLQC